MKARAVQFVAPRRVELASVDLPDLGKGDALVRTRYSGISAGTEMLAYRGDIDPDLALDSTIDALGGTFSYPFRYGYSCVGHVERSAGGLREGSLVFAFHPHQDLFVIKSSNLISLPDIDPRIATLLAIVETALQISLDAGTLQERRVVVLGLGAVGMLTAVLLKEAGAIAICAEPKAWRREMAATLDLQAVAPEQLEAVVEQETRGSGVDLIVEASGNPDALQLGLRLLAHEGVALVASWFGCKPVPLQLGREFHRRRLTLRSTQVSTIPARLSNEWTIEKRRKVATSLLEELPLGSLATREFPFTDAPHAFAAIDRGDERFMHAVLRYD